ncbi:flavodoxin-dependent (E)-4-hydroxy-3-methylbut-2-enyl-diphosphate synthase [[Mycoplasma] testudinis]|uniref:flavodoxin-dependent (E)-4-hydroxy-3-methylbut-2-enyl-diphosphate synthase n=1 Tax=[Mycoplasma] testudinis TaxID=33924 RepID=UPI00048A28B7|nr:flavodoxin-dependent (E)-4-hydroxy-3-methylbut-2-enyl-diphosphate synthase [[Mycoplasma] testudinis]
MSSKYTRRWQTKPVMVGNYQLGGSNKIYLQSMTITKTKKVNACLKEIQSLVDEGADFVRVAVFDDADAKAIRDVVKKAPCPIIADIHFNPDYAIASLKAGVAKVRLNPGNISNQKKLKEIVDLANQRQVPIRVGVNSGSLPMDLMNKYGVTARAMNLAAKRYVKILNNMGFDNIVISLKTSTPMLSIEAYEMGARWFKYPLHLGITEAGTVLNGAIKSVAGLTPLLLKGIGDTLRISLASDPVEEIKVAKRMLNSLGLYDNLVNVVACPTCGRLNFDMFPVVAEIEDYVKKMSFPLRVSILGCTVNGPGEAREADIGIAGGAGKGIIFKKGVAIKSVPEDQLVSELKKLIDEEHAKYLAVNNEKK